MRENVQPVENKLTVMVESGTYENGLEPSESC